MDEDLRALERLKDKAAKELQAAYDEHFATPIHDAAWNKYIELVEAVAWIKAVRRTF